MLRLDLHDDRAKQKALKTVSSLQGTKFEFLASVIHFIHLFFSLGNRMDESVSCWLSSYFDLYDQPVLKNQTRFYCLDP